LESKTSIIIDKSEGQTKRQQSVTNVNPNATDKQMYDFAQGLVSLSTDTFDGAVRVDCKELTANNMQLFGANELVTRFYIEGNPQDGSVSSYYEVADGNGNIQSATINYTVGEYDMTKAYIEAIQQDMGQQGLISYIEFFIKVNEHIEIPVTVSAAGDFGSLSKTVRLVGLKEAE